MATATQVSLDVYLTTMFEPDAEYVDGYIEERPMGQYDHASWQQAIQHWFLTHSLEWNVRVRPETPRSNDEDELSCRRCRRLRPRQSY